MTARTSENSPDDSAGRPRSQSPAVSQSQIIGNAPVSGFLRVADLQDKMLGEFRLLRRIGGGGMAEVWLAEQTSLKRQVAVKVMKPATQADETCRRRFEQEAFATAGLNHPSIAQVYAIGEAEGVNYIAQEYVAGMNMRDYILKKGPPPVHIAVHLMKQVAAALQAAAVRPATPEVTKLTEPQAREALSTVINLLAPSLTVDQIARLSAINIMIADMNEQRALGLTLASNLIVLDDDAAGARPGSRARIA